MDTPSFRPQEPGPDASAFAVGYKAHQGDMMVYGGGALTIFGVVGTIVHASPLGFIASAVGTMSAVYFVPTMDVRSPQLGASQDELFVAKVGVLPWSRVTEMFVQYRALRTMRLATLIVRTEGKVSEALERSDGTFWGKFSAQNARVSGNILKVQLHTLAMAPQDVEQRLLALRGR
ncbi:MAG: hypothetical protein AAF580_11525 [Pseudomonadota bacterium]